MSKTKKYLKQTDLSNFFSITQKKNKRLISSNSPRKSLKTEEKDLNDENSDILDFSTKIISSLDKSWLNVCQTEFNKPYFKKLLSKLYNEIKSGCKIYPPLNKIFNAFNYTHFDSIKVVIIGQDPYHNACEAEGLCFSVPMGIKIPSSLRNIYTEIKKDIKKFNIPTHGNLINWAKQGVLLLNTVRANNANSHRDFGWQSFTDEIISILNKNKSGLIFIAWGRQAQDKIKYISKEKHHILISPHPSGLSAFKKTINYPDGFFNNHHFSIVNEILIKQGKKPIDWQI